MRRMIALLSVLILALVACGDDDTTLVSDDTGTTLDESSTTDDNDSDDDNGNDDTTTTEAETTTTTEPRPAYTGGFEVDYETGNVTIDTYAAFLEEHGAPEGGAEAAAVELLSDIDAEPSVSSLAADGGRTLVTVEYDDLADDSVAAERYEIVFVGDGDDMFIESGSWASRCQEGRGHQDYAVDLCL